MGKKRPIRLQGDGHQQKRTKKVFPTTSTESKGKKSQLSTKEAARSDVTRKKTDRFERYKLNLAICFLRLRDKRRRRH